MNDMNELVLDFLQDIYYAERAGIRAMSKMARAAEGNALKGLLTDHRKLSETQVSRLEDVFGTLNERPKAKQCAAMDGLIHEAEDCIEHSGKGPVLDAALIACAQAMDHYEIARYGALIAWMGTMGNEAGTEILRGILAEEKEADARFNDLALSDANPAANEVKPDEDKPGEEEPEPEPAPEPTGAKAPRKAAGKAPPKTAKAKAASTPRAKKAVAKDPEPAAPAPVADEPEAPEPTEMEEAPAPAAKRKGPARKKATAPEPEPEVAEPEPEPAPAAKAKRGRQRAKA